MIQRREYAPGGEGSPDIHAFAQAQLVGHGFQ